MFHWIVMKCAGVVGVVLLGESEESTALLDN